jgi:predicted site-specific integrase-resolvase
VVLGLATRVNKKRCVVSGRVCSSALRKRLVVDAWVEAIGSGLNVERKPLLALVDRISAGAVGVLILAHQERLARFGFPLDPASLCQTPV